MGGVWHWKNVYEAHAAALSLLEAHARQEGFEVVDLAADDWQTQIVPPLLLEEGLEIFVQPSQASEKIQPPYKEYTLDSDALWRSGNRRWPEGTTRLEVLGWYILFCLPPALLFIGLPLALLIWAYIHR